SEKKEGSVVGSNSWDENDNEVEWIKATCAKFARGECAQVKSGLIDVEQKNSCLSMRNNYRLEEEEDSTRIVLGRDSQAARVEE
ncbi:hypothetical protein HAX54_046144, partial [Datura stramonium]|nr:hypothetical protein [Datura stramonium]